MSASANPREVVQDLLEHRDWPPLLALAREDRRLLGRLLPFTYQPEGLLRWRAVEALGLAAGAVAERDPEYVRGILRRLHWSLSDESGGIGWSAPEAMGEIVAARPDLFADWAPIVASLFTTMEEDYFRPGIIWGVGRIAGPAPTLVREAYPDVAACLAEHDPRVRGLAAWCLGQLGHPEATTPLRQLLADPAPLEIYEEGLLRATTVGELAREALARLRQEHGQATAPSPTLLGRGRGEAARTLALPHPKRSLRPVESPN